MATTLTLSTTEILASANEILAAHNALINKIRADQQTHRRQLHSLQPTPNEILRLPLLPSPSPSPPPHEESPPPSPQQRLVNSDLPAIKHARAVRYPNYVPDEETIRNDYSQRYVDGGEWPQNWVLGAEPERRFEEYPKQQRLLNLKKASVNNYSLPPSYLPYSQLSALSASKFDVILLDPPFSSSFTWENLQDLPIPSLAADPSFVFLWVGSGAGEGLERGREVLAKWGYRRCEDVVWVKTNKTTNQGPGTDPPTTSLLTRTKQHCLIGIRGTVRRSTDSWFVHCNVDTDVIIWEGDPTDPTRKPPEMYTLVENFCLGLRRLEIFGRPSSLRRGWVTVLGPGQEAQLDTLEDGTVHVAGGEGGRGALWTQGDWDEGVKALANGGRAVVPMTPEIDALRPKSPVRAGQHHPQQQSGGGGVGGAGGAAMGQNPGMTATPMHMPHRFNGGGGGGGGGGGRGGGGGFSSSMGTSGGTMMGPPSQLGGGVNGGVRPMVPMGVQQMMGNPGLGGVEDMMGAAWNSLTTMNHLSAMNAGVLNPGMGMMMSPVMNNAMGGGGMGMQGNNMQNMAQNLQNLQGMQGMQQGMGGHGHGMAGNLQANMQMNLMQQMGQMPGMNSGGFGQGMPMFNPAAAMGNWGDQGQFGGMEQGWDGDGMAGMGVPNMMGGVNMPGMHPGGMGMGQWGGPGGNF